MKTGDIIFVRSNSLSGKLIRFFDKGRFNHVAIAVSDTEIFEAEYYTRAHIIKMEYDDYEIVDLNFTDEEKVRLVEICHQLEGKWYDYIQILGYVFKYFFNANVGFFNNPNMLICSEAISLILFDLGRIKSRLGNITPNKLYNLLKNM